MNTANVRPPRKRKVKPVPDVMLKAPTFDPVVATNPSHLQDLVSHAIMFHGPNVDLNHIDVSNITDFSDLFFQSPFNGDISQWNTSKVTNMNSMFCNGLFDGDISKWNVAAVTSMAHMFTVSTFNGDISQWNVGSVLDMREMFLSTPFNQDISGWNTQSVLDMQSMFDMSAFTGDISRWNVNKVINFKSMFENSPFAGDLSQWNWNKKADIDGLMEPHLLVQCPAACLYHWYVAVEDKEPKYLLSEHRAFFEHYALMLAALCDKPAQMTHWLDQAWRRSQSTPALHLALPELE